MKNHFCHTPNSCDTPPTVMVTQTTDGLKSLSNVVVRVLSNNTIYYVSRCHEISVIDSGLLFIDNYAFAENPLGLREQMVFDFKNNVAAAYNAIGDYRTFKLEGGK